MDRPFKCNKRKKVWSVEELGGDCRLLHCPFCLYPHQLVSSGMENLQVEVQSIPVPERILKGTRADYYHRVDKLVVVDDDELYDVIHNNYRRNIPYKDELPEGILIDNDDAGEVYVFVRKSAGAFKPLEHPVDESQT